MTYSFLQSLLYWLEPLALLFALLSALWFIIWTVWQLWSRKTSTSSYAYYTWRILLLNAGRFAARFMAIALVIAVSGVTSWTLRDQQLLANTMTFRQVRVVSKVSDRRYFMQPVGMKIYDWEFCHTLTPPAEVVDIKFEQRDGCKQVVGVGFLEISPKEGNYDATVQTGRDPTTAATAAKALVGGRR